MNTSNLRILLLCLLLTGFMGCEGAEKAISPELKNKIVYVSEQGICTINPDGTDLKVIVALEKGGRFSNPKWSPDKRRIAFNGKVKGSNRIMIVNSDGSDLKIFGLPEPKPKKLKPGEVRIALGKYNLYFHDWSPSGKQFSYSLPDMDVNYIGVMNKNGEIKTELYGRGPCFTGEDSIIFVASGISKTTAVETKIVRYDLKKNKSQILTQGEGVSYYSLSSSPRVDKIAYGIDSVALYNELWIMDLNGSEKKKLASQNKDFVGRFFSVIKFPPDQTKILFLPDNSYKSRIYVVNIDGTGLYAVTSDIVNAGGGADWSPDGRNIIFTSNKDGNNELYIINVDGTALRRLTNSNFNNCCPDWCSR